MTVAVLGTGLLGYSVAQRLLDAGYPVCVYNRTKAKAKPLARKGARVAATAGEAVEISGCVILMLADYKAILDVLFAKRGSRLSGKTVIQMGTIAPSESQDLARRVKARGGEYLECPVLGSRGEAANGTLILMAGGSKQQFKKWGKLLKVLGPQPRYIGEVGKAAALKLALNQLIASHAAGFCLSLGLIERSGVNVKTFMDILNQSALYARMFTKKLPNWLERDYDNPNFPARHLLKDVNLIIREARGLQLSADVIQGIRKVLRKTVDRGLGKKDYSALYEIINNR